MAGIGVLVFWLVSLGTAAHRGLAAWDEPVWRFFSSHRSDQLISLARHITSLGVVGVLLPTSVAMGAVLFLWRRSLVLAVIPWVSVQVTALLVSDLKRHFGTARPPLADQVVVVLNPAFPSGHAADTVALLAAVAIIVCSAPGLTRTWRRVVIGVAVALGATMGATRLILNVHWLSDVIGGSCLGLAVASLVALGGISLTQKHQQ